MRKRKLLHEVEATEETVVLSTEEVVEEVIEEKVEEVELWLQKKLKKR